MDSHWILLIDPFKNLLNAYRMILEEENYCIDTALNTKDAHSLFDKRPYSAILMEYIPPLEHLQGLIRGMKEKSPEIYILLVTNAAVDETTYEKLFEIGVDDFILKPYSPQKIIAHIKKGLRQREVTSKVRGLERLNLLDPISGEMEGVVFNKIFLNRCLRQEIKKARRHSRFFTILLVGIPTEDRAGERYVHFHGELLKMIRSFIREEDVVARNNGEIALLLPETDQMGSKALGGRLSHLIRNHPPFQHDDLFQAMAQILSFQYFTYPNPFDLPEPLAAAVKDL
ncbi:MAG: response regulator [Deltaproteobacteria bacterium]|nr:response regulator [Deltaproteobacteria bacterium]